MHTSPTTNPAPNPAQAQTRATVLGIGDGGIQAIRYLHQHHGEGLQFLALNRKPQSIGHTSSNTSTHIDFQTIDIPNLPPNRSPAPNPKPLQAALHKIQTDTLFLCAGLGGNTGSYATPEIAALAHKQGHRIIAIVTTPFAMEGNTRQETATQAIKALRPVTHQLHVLANEQLHQFAAPSLPLEQAFTIYHRKHWEIVQQELY